MRCTLRRDPADPPPWKVDPPEAERSVDDEDWGGTFDEMFMMPSSVRGQLHTYFMSHHVRLTEVS